MRVFAVLLSFVLFSGCQREPSKTIGVVPKGANHIFWQTVRAGAVKAAREGGYQVEWNAPDLEIDSSRQIAIVESMINKQLAGIVLAPVDRKALVSVVERAGKAGIPVAIFDSAIDTKQRISYVATDNVEGGRMAARRLASLIGNKGKVAVVTFMAGSAATEERTHGFEDEIRLKYPEINIVARQFGMADRAKSMAVTENIMTAHPDLAGLFADNESSSSGAVQALKVRRNRRVKMVAFDHAENLIEDMKAGWIDSLLVQNPFKMGEASTSAILAKLRGETPLAHVDSGIALVTKADLEKPEIKSLLFPDIDRYLKAK
jgi:ribose transport system substrate-binding protein